MSRSGYSEECDGWGLICWRGAVNSALRGKRGQAFLIELRDALDAMPNKALISDELEHNGSYCTLGVIGAARGIDMDGVDAYDREQVAKVFGIAEAMAAEIMFENDHDFAWSNETPEQRWTRMRGWVEQKIRVAQEQQP